MRTCLTLIFTLAAALLQAQEQAAPSAGTPYVEREEKQFNFFPGGKIAVSAEVPASVRIVGWQKGSVRMEAEKIVYYSSIDEAKAILKEHPLRVRWNQTSSAIRIPRPPSGQMEVNLTLYVPGERTDVTVKLERGDFSIESLNGWIEVTTGEGTLEAKSVSGYFSGNTLHGDIFVELSGNRWRGLEFAAVTQQGSANLKLPVQFSAALQLETRNGKIAVDYPEQIVDGEPQPPDIVIGRNSQSLKAAVGDGGSPVRLVTHSGDITLSKID